MRYYIKPVGIVSNEINQKGRFNFDNIISSIALEPKYTRVLDGIEEFSHVIVIFWLHKIKKYERMILKTHPRKDPSLPLTGIFATRSPARPNPIGISAVKLLEVKSTTLTVLGLDAINGTPVLDIKPYMPESFSISDLKLPAWAAVINRHGT